MNYFELSSDSKICLARLIEVSKHHNPSLEKMEMISYYWWLAEIGIFLNILNYSAPIRILTQITNAMMYSQVWLTLHQYYNKI